MITEEQTEVMGFLASPAVHGGAPVERVETHASVVFLAGARAFKLKRAVRYDYLDFSTKERRKAMCKAEVRINRRTAPALYRGVVAVTREKDGLLALGGSGDPVEWLVEMVRFDQAGLLDRLAARGALDLGLMRPLASAIARFHLGAERRRDHGGRSGMAWVVDGNAIGFAEQGRGILDSTICASLTTDTCAALDRQGALLDARREAGFVRQCHGDLHLRNIVQLDGCPTPFDAIEFNDEIACTDVLYDLAFLLMDLWRRQLPQHANVVWNGYLSETTDLKGIPLLPLFLSCRAAVRAKTSATAANLQSDPSRRSELQALARDYLATAMTLLHPPGPCLVAIGGFSGSGKSTLAVELAPSLGAVPGAVVIRSDEIRKRLCGVEPLVRLGPESYTADVSRRVYGTVAERAGVIVRGGHAAIADAVFARPADRSAIEQVAVDAGVPFVGIWLDAPESILIARSERRQLDPSDADTTVIRQQITQDTGPIRWLRVDATPAIENNLQNTTDALHSRLPDGILRAVRDSPR
jgi:aminoglycoside phosphotransferase family enzyme/predicted kinase